MPVAAMGIPRRMANGCTEVMKTVGVQGIQSSSLGGRGWGGKGGGGRFGLTVGVVAVVVVVVRQSPHRGEAASPSTMKARRWMCGNESDRCGDA
jgi:hypothetical protein